MDQATLDRLKAAVSELASVVGSLTADPPPKAADPPPVVVEPPAPKLEFMAHDPSGWVLGQPVTLTLDIQGYKSWKWAYVSGAKGNPFVGGAQPGQGNTVVFTPKAAGDLVKAWPEDLLDNEHARDSAPMPAATPAPQPQPQPQPATGAVNILLRGQSNAYLFKDKGGLAMLGAKLQAAIPGLKLNLLADFDNSDQAASIFSGTAFMDWPKNGQQKSLLAFVSQQSVAIRALPTVTLWMHNENDGNSGVSKADWLKTVRDDAVLVRQALGQGAATTPYVFTYVRYNYGQNQAPRQGMMDLVADAVFNASFVESFTNTKMDFDGKPNGSHMGPGDHEIVASALAAGMVPVVRKLAGLGLQPAPQPNAPPPSTAPAQPSDDYAFALKVRAGFGVSFNIERDDGAGVDVATLRRLQAQGLGGLRIFPPASPRIGPFPSAGEIERYLDTVAAANSLGIPCIFDFMDYGYVADVQNAATQPYIKRVAGQFAARNFDPLLAVPGAINEMAMTNDEAAAFRALAVAAISAANPKHVIHDGGGEWGDPEKGLMKSSLLPQLTQRRLMGWHQYHLQADDMAAAAAIGAKVRAWAAANKVVAICSEWGKGPASGTGEPGNSKLIPQVVRAGYAGFADQRPLVWTLNGPKRAWWKASKPSGLDLRDDVAAAVLEAKAALTTSQS